MKDKVESEEYMNTTPVGATLHMDTTTDLAQLPSESRVEPFIDSPIYKFRRKR